MPTADTARQHLISTIASLSRHHPDDPKLPELRAELVTMGLSARITKTINSAPPLSPDQRNRLVQAVYGNLGRG